MKKIILIVLSVIVVLSFMGCSNNSDSPKGRSGDGIVEFLNEKTKKPLILYECREIGKSQNVSRIYVVEKGQCRTYNCKITLGELARMTDKEIMEMLEENYANGLQDAIDAWMSDPNICTATINGEVKRYVARTYDITSVLFTDETGNTVIGEMLFLPKAGIDDEEYVIKYPQYTDSEKWFMNYFGIVEDRDTYRDIKFDIEYFSTGMGIKSDLNQINNVYYINNDAATSGTVYESFYYGFCSRSDKWVYNERILCFRVDKPDSVHLQLDDMSSQYVTYVDPTDKDLRRIANHNENAYYASFEPLSPPQTIKTIENDILTVGVAADYEPFEYLDASGTIVGAEIEILTAIAEELDLEVQFKNIPFGDLMDALLNEEVDCIAGCIEKTERREEQALVSNVMFIEKESSGTNVVTLIGKSNAILRERMNEAIYKLQQDGTFTELLNKYDILHSIP